MRKIRLVWQYVRHLAASGNWWILPIVLSLLILGSILVATHASPLAPFIYTLF